MKRLKYYFDYQHKILVAYNHQTEFFAKYVENANEWEKCRITFMQFEHDYCYKCITWKEAMKLSKGKSAYKMFKQYVDMLNENLNCTL